MSTTALAKSEPLLEALSKAQAASVDRAKTYHVSCLKAFGDQMGYAFLAGLELNTLREQIEADHGYGHFTKFRETHLPEIPNGSAYRYMDFQKRLVDTFPTVGKVQLLGNGASHLSEGDKEKVLKAVHKMADGKTLTQLYRDLGVIRDKEHQKHTPAKPLSAEEQIAAETEQLRAPLAALLEHAQIIRDRGEAENAKVAPKDWAILLDALIPICKLARALRKSKRAKKGAKS